MRFLTVNPHGELTVTGNLEPPYPHYAILSHTWGADDEEVTFDDLEHGRGKGKQGYKKLEFCIAQARKDRLSFVWVDTCSINKADFTELDEAIRSMFRWYRNAQICYVYLSDVTADTADHKAATQLTPPWESAFRKSRWFTRGWTLQELLAPEAVAFFSQDGIFLGTKRTLEQQIHEITEIPVAALHNESLSNFSIKDRLQWANKRETRRIEDKAYCLLGIFDVFMSTKYGEGDNAFERLKKKIGITVDQIDSAIQRAYSRERLAVERLSGKSLPLEDCFVNLCIVSHDHDSDVRSRSDTSKEHSGEGQLLSPFSLAARLKVDTPPESKQVSLESLFNPRSQKNGTKSRPNRVLIWGRAGMGKTTLCKKMVHDFYHNGLWRGLYDRVVWLPLRRMKKMEGEVHNITELLQKVFDLNGPEKNLSARLQSDVIDNERTLFILDGLDEVSYALDPDSLKAHVLSSLLARRHTVITSRPHSTSIFGYTPPDLELETVGFFPQQVDEYIQRVAGRSDTPGTMVSEIQSFIQNRPLVQSLARIPIQLDAICYSWNSKHFFKDNISMTVLYQLISQKLWAKDVIRLGKTSDGTPITDRQLDDSLDVEIFVQPESQFLQELAFQGLYSEIIEFDTTYLKMANKGQPILGDSPVHMSFLRSSDSSLEASDRTLHFIHLTFQEFFAARYFVRHWIYGKELSLCNSPWVGFSSGDTKKMEPEEFLRTEKYIGRYDIFWRFVVGLLQAEGDHRHLQQFFRVLDDEPFDLIGLTHQRLTIHCISEINPANGELHSLVQKRADHYVQWILFESRLRKSASRTSLLWEAECSDDILKILLEKYETRTETMEMLCHRTNVSSSILDVVLHTLKEDTNTATRRAAIQVLSQNCSQSQEEKFLNFWRSVQHSSTMVISEILEVLMMKRKIHQPVVEALIALLQQQEWGVRSKAAKTLGCQTSLPTLAVDVLIALLQDPDRGVRSEAAKALSHQTNLPISAVEALIALLQDPEWGVRSEAAKALSHQTDLPTSATEALIALLQDPNWGVRSEAAKALSHQTNLPTSATEALIALLQDPKCVVRSKAAKVLSHQTDLPTSATEALIALLQDPEWVVWSKAAKALSHQTNLPTSATEALIALLQDPKGRVRSKAAKALSHQTNLPISAIEALITLLQDPDWGVRSEAAKALSHQTNLPTSATEALIALLQDPNWGVRSEAAKALSHQTNLPTSATEALIALLQDPKRVVRSETAEALSHQTNLPISAIEALIALLQDPEWGVRFEAAKALGCQTNLPISAIEALIALLHDPDRGVRSKAAKVLSHQTNLPTSATEALIALLHDPDWGVRSEAAKVLSHQTNLPTSATEALIALLQDPDWGVRSEAAKALSHQTNLPTSATEALIALLQDPEWGVRSEAAKALSHQTNLPISATEALIALLQDPEWRVRSEAAKALGCQTNLPTSAIEALIALLLDSERQVQSEAAKALGHHQTSLPTSAIEVLIALLQHSEWQVRSEAAKAIGHHQTNLPTSAIEALIALLQHPEWQVQSETAKALSNYQTNLPISAVKALIALLQHREWWVRFRAAKALRHQTSLPTSAVEALIALLQHPEWWVRFEAVKALGYHQSNLPTSAVEALIALLQQPERSVQIKAAQILYSHNIFSLIPDLDSLALQGPLEASLVRSSVTWFVWKSNFCIDIGGSLRTMPLRKEQQALFMNACLKARKALEFPPLDVLEKVKKGKRRKRSKVK